jgi:hypothetical protein
MPTLEGDSPGHEQRPRYQVEGRAVLVYRDERVYVGIDSEDSWRGLTSLPEVRELAETEIRSFEQTLHFPLPELKAREVASKGVFGLGDAVAWLARKLGFSDCGPCRRRRVLLNRLVIWGWWRA